MMHQKGIQWTGTDFGMYAELLLILFFVAIIIINYLMSSWVTLPYLIVFSNPNKQA